MLSARPAYFNPNVCSLGSAWKIAFLEIVGLDLESELISCVFSNCFLEREHLISWLLILI
jgi:hypothetical protein